MDGQIHYEKRVKQISNINEQKCILAKELRIAVVIFSLIDADADGLIDDLLGTVTRCSGNGDNCGRGAFFQTAATATV
uniref:Uncharacterized protein n=1 Tax=Romanomermis culicivorax TaxID=13658 RepID=A0A915KSU0_ROMCU